MKLAVFVLFLFAVPATAQVNTFESPDVCVFWESRITRMTSSFSWERTALHICKDYHEAEKEKYYISDKLQAGMTLLDEMEKEWNERVSKRLELLRQADKEPEDKAIKLKEEAYKLNFTPNTPYEMADKKGILLMLEDLENGY